MMAPTIPRPEPLQVILDQIPGALKLKKQWVLWRYVWKNDKAKWDKPPFQPNGKLASSTAAHTWSLFETVEAVYKSGLNLPVDDPHHYDGVGFVPHTVGNTDLQIVFGDLDKCREKETGKISPEALQDLQSINSYCEPSPSGTGLRFVAYGAPPFPPEQNGRKKGHIELYQGGHYLTITGQRLPDFPATIEKRPEELNAFYQKHFGKSEPGPKKESSQSTKLTDDQIICLASEAKNSAKFMTLLDGNISGYPSPSEAEQAFCNLVAFYTTNEAQIDSIFRRSMLYREKWERTDYREGTIRKAISGSKEHYSGNGSKDFEAATEKQKSNDQDGSESDAAADEAEAKAATRIEEPILITDITDIRYGKDGEKKGVELSTTMAARAVIKKKILAMSEDSEDIYRFDGQIYRADGARKIDMVLCGLVGDALDIKTLKEVLRRVRNELLENPVVFEPDPYLLPAKNVVCDLRTGKVRKPQAEDLLLEQLDIVYDPEATCQAFLAFLESITPNITDRLMLIDWFVATAIREPLAFVLFLLGLGRNGKGIYEKLIKKFFGMSSFRDMPLAEVTKNNFAASGFYRKRGWIASETGTKKAGIGTDFMKLVSGNGVIDGDRKNKSRIQFEPYFQTIVDTNTMPTIKDSSIGWTERFCKANLPYIFVMNPDTEKNPLEKQRDPDLFAKLTTPNELSGILNLILYRSPEIAKTKTITKRPGAEMFAEYNEQSSSVSTFLDLFCEFVTDGADFWTPSGPVYESYCKWCNYKVGEVVDIRYFGKQLRKFCGGFEPKRGKDADRKSTTLYKRLNFDSNRCDEVLETLRTSISKDVSMMSQSVSMKSQLEKSQQITMSQLSQSKQWDDILKRFGKSPISLYKEKGENFIETIELIETSTAGEREFREPDRDTIETKQDLIETEADQQDVAREQTGIGPHPKKDEPTPIKSKEDPGRAKFKAGMKKRSCLMCGEHFSYDLGIHYNGGYICAKCHREGPPTVAENPPNADAQVKLSEVSINLPPHI